MDWTFSLVGFGVGALVGLTGVGGGALMTPVLVLGLGVPVPPAVGTDLLFAAFTKAGGSCVYARAGQANWALAGWLAAGSVPAALATLAALGLAGVAAQGMVASVLGNALGVALIGTAIAMLFRKQLARTLVTASAAPRRTAARTVLVGIAIGVLVTLSSVGAGAIGVAALALLRPGLAPRRLVATDIVHAVPLAFVAGAGRWALGNVDWSLLGALLVGSLPGVWLGARASAAIPAAPLRGVLASALVLSGARLIG
jgi:uncharacterized protein